MRSVPWWKIVVVLVVLIWAVYQVYPSVVWYSLPREQQNEFKNDEILRLEKEMDDLKVKRESADTKEKRDEISSQIANLSRQISQQKNILKRKQQKAIPLGLDLKGGVHVVLKVELAEDPRQAQAQDEETQKRRRQEKQYYLIDQVIESLRNRIDNLGVREPLIQRQGDDRIVVQIPSITDPAEVLQVIGKTAQLEFRFANTERGNFRKAYEVIQKIDETFPEAHLAEKVEAGPGHPIPWILREDFPHFQEVLFKKDEEGRYTNVLKDEIKALCPYGYSLMFGNPEQYNVTENKTVFRRMLYLISDKVELRGDTLVDASVQLDATGTGGYHVSLTFNADGAKIFSVVTGSHVGDNLAIVLDGTVYSAPTIQGKIPGGNAQITGNFTLDEAKLLAVVLRSGALPASVTIEENRIIDPTLGADSIRNGIYAGLFGVLATILFMVLYYSLSGLIADVALLLNFLLLAAAMAFLPATLTLPGIAGIFLTLGMAVDANVLIFERIREEMQGHAERPLPIVIDRGFGRAFMTIFDSNITTLISAVVLFQFGTGPVKGFAVTLSLGIIISMFTAIFVCRIFFDFLVAPGRLKKLPIGGLRLFANANYNFIKSRYYAFGFSTLFILTGLVYLIAAGERNLGVDLTSGSAMTFKFEQEPDENALRNILSNAGVPGITLYKFSSQPEEVVIRSKSIEPQEGFKSLGAYIESVLNREIANNPARLLQDDTVGPTVGGELIRKGIWALVASMVFIIIYIAVRFEFKYGVAAVIALFHDLFFTLGVFCLTNLIPGQHREINLPIIAALLTIMGYSLNDTIVVFDRIRENRRPGRGTFDKIVNDSINQTLSRTIITGSTTLFVLIFLLLMGGPGINDFIYVLLIGVIVGTYSSVYIASPVLLWWHEWDQKKAKAAKW